MKTERIGAKHVLAGIGREERLTILGYATIVILVKDGSLLGYREFNTGNPD